LHIEAPVKESVSTSRVASDAKLRCAIRHRTGEFMARANVSPCQPQPLSNSNRLVALAPAGMMVAALLVRERSPLT